MNKTLQRLGLTAVSAGLLAGAMPAHAADYTISATTMPGTSSGRVAFTAANCELTPAVNALNGVDTRIVNVAGKAGQTITISWSAAASSEGWLTPSFWSPSCAPTVHGSNPSELRSRGATRLTVPTGTKWLVMEGFAVADVRFSVN